MMAKIKGPKIDKGKKVPVPEEGGQTDHLPPFLCLVNLAKGFCVLDCCQQDQAAFAKALRDISRRSWLELKQAPRKGVGFETIYKMKKEIPDHLSSKRIIAFRISDIFRLIGYREQRVFHILWVDPHGSTYDH